MAFWNSLSVEIAGIHVTQSDLNRPTHCLRLSEPFTGQTNIDDTIAQIRISKSTDLKEGTYDIVFTTKGWLHK